MNRLEMLHALNSHATEMQDGLAVLSTQVTDEDPVGVAVMHVGLTLARTMEILTTVIATLD
jgi:hypothetical protein